MKNVARKLPPVITRNGECVVCWDCLVRWARYTFKQRRFTYNLCKRCLTKREKVGTK